MLLFRSRLSSIFHPFEYLQTKRRYSTNWTEMFSANSLVVRLFTVTSFQKWLMNVSVSRTILCSCEMAANSLSHSSSRTAHRAKSRVRLLFVMVTFDDELDIASIDEYVELSFDIESYEMWPDDGDTSRTVAFDEPVNLLQCNCQLNSSFQRHN